ncbi:DNA gyrase subunit A [compost metagenome]
MESDKKLTNVIKKELLEIREKYGIDRRSEIQGEVEELKVNLEVLVTQEDVLVTLSGEGYIKRTSMLSFTRSGGERDGSGVKEGDYIKHILDVSTLENLLIFTQRGQYFLLPVHQVPEFKWKDNGTAIVNVIPLTKEDRIVSVIPVKNFDDDASLVFVTKRGQVKRTELKEYQSKRSGAIAAAKVGPEDAVISVTLSRNTRDIFLISKLGMAIRFNEQEVSSMGRVSGGVRGIQLREDDEVAAALWVDGEEGEVLVISDLGYAKRSLLLDYPTQTRGGKGIQSFEFKEGKRVKPNGSRIAGAYFCKEPLQITAVNKDGKTFIFSSEQAPIMDRKSIGKAMSQMDKNDEIVDLFVNKS